MAAKGFARNETGYIKNMTDEEFNLLLSGLEGWELNYRLIFFIMYYMGLRIGEVVTLKHSDIIGDHLRVNLWKQNKIIERVIPEIVKKELEIYLFATKDFRTNNYLFQPNPRSASKNQYLRKTSVNWKFSQIRKKLGLDDVYHICIDGKKLYRISPHTCRHAFITKFYHKSGNDLILTQRVIGHKKVETTANYIFDHKEKEREIVNSMI